ncbi:ABC transporter permease [Pseudarthrobacter sp. NamE2]|uniref:ABC transporter permease n=1 Tax=Pseudarthrobacter sp. NamE2 TaxID=2576838 RepID=UPI0010FEC361|nr:ABC transporter permease [Pseudarthrobacter sp. NamE2]TLM85648.1 ABC transporter permease [Pseudarthrobacter sp. NamE2]
MSAVAQGELTTPGLGGGLRDIRQSGFLLKLLVRKELKVRYRGSVLGLLWSYVKPAVQFIVFYIALGVFLGLERSPRNPEGLTNYAVYLFSGIVLINFFSEALGNAARSIVNNGNLIKKIYLPRELFPVASVWVSAVHFFPQMVVLLVGCIIAGWRPDFAQILAAIAGFAIVGMLATGLGLLFGAVNVYFRDSENLVDMLLMIATWASPVMYAWNMVQEKLGSAWFAVYQANPVTIGVELFHYAFWFSTTDGSAPMPPNLFVLWTPVGLGIALLILVLGQMTFRRLEGRFAQEL